MFTWPFINFLTKFYDMTLFQFSASPSPILGTMEIATFAYFMKKSMHLKTVFLLDYQVLWMDHKSKTVCSLIDQFRSIYDVRK